MIFTPLSSGDGELRKLLYFLKFFAQLDLSFAEKFCIRVKFYYVAHATLSDSDKKTVVSIDTGEEGPSRMF